MPALSNPGWHRSLGGEIPARYRQFYVLPNRFRVKSWSTSCEIQLTSKFRIFPHLVVIFRNTILAVGILYAVTHRSDRTYTLSILSEVAKPSCSGHLIINVDVIGKQKSRASPALSGITAFAASYITGDYQTARDRSPRPYVPKKE